MFFYTVSQQNWTVDTHIMPRNSHSNRGLLPLTSEAVLIIFMVNYEVLAQDELRQMLMVINLDYCASYEA